MMAMALTLHMKTTVHNKIFKAVECFNNLILEELKLLQKEPRVILLIQ